MHMEFSMRSLISYTALGAALVAGASVAHAQTVETVTTPLPGPMVIAQQPVATVPVATAPVETVRTVRTTTTTPRRRFVRGARSRVTTTRTTVSERIVPVPVAPAVAAIASPAYPYSRLYDVVTPGAVVAAPAVSAIGATAAVPVYRYVYEPNRILVIDPYTNIAVQAIPR